MSNVEEKLAKSLTAETTELIPYLPYLLQDLWELGSGPKGIKELVLKNISISENTKILDLACGKGAVSIQLAKAFGCKVKGIDILPEFIDYARKKAEEYSIQNLCEFKVEDINQSVINEEDYDIVILGAVGDVLGNTAETLSKLKRTVKKGGYIFIDDAYSLDGSNERYLSREQWNIVFRDAGVALVDEKIIDDSELEEINKYNQDCIIARANELKKANPEKAEIFEGYIRSQQAECDELEGDITGVTWLLQVI
ncbi:MAG: class I SAM-dependent methyltransferase [Clostridia bacterium]|nr:class I SAM-dependent methyltransferase [Clostridia bacterium]